MVNDDTATTIAAYIALAVPITVAISNLARIFLEWLNQKHLIKTSNIEQNHQITTQYLDKALDPQVPLAIRHQLLRFLATPEKDGSRLEAWAESELERIGGIVDETNRAVEDAEKELHSAESHTEISIAEQKLQDAVNRQQSLLQPPVKPSISGPALKAGLIEDKVLNGIELIDQDLVGMRLVYRELRGANFSGSDLTKANFQGSDLRAANFTGSILEDVNFYGADLRGSNLNKSKLNKADLQQARLEGSNLSEVEMEEVDLRATYDATTIWPDNYNPDKAGAVLVKSDEK